MRGKHFNASGCKKCFGRSLNFMTGKTILVTGGAGYIASHVVLELVAAGFEPIIFDNFSNSSPLVIERLEALLGKSVSWLEGDCRNEDTMDKVFQTYTFDGVMHFAGLKAVCDSVSDPLGYYDHNVSGFITTLRAAKRHYVHDFIFSSSATVYAGGNGGLISENADLGPINPYGQSKLICEKVLQDLCVSEPKTRTAIMRYFNPIGAHPSGQIGEFPNQTPNNLLPFIDRVASGKVEHLTVYGNDYDTPDGTGVRDYIHVLDLARGHVRALDFLKENKGAHIFNLGTGQGTSVLELVEIYKKVNNCEVPYIIGSRRAGDQPTVIADPKKAMSQLNFDCQYTTEQACLHSWNWQSLNPLGYV